MAGLMKMMMDKNLAPGWFYLDRQKGMDEAEIMEKIQLELYNEVFNRGYNTETWTDAFIERVAELYFNHFQKLYEVSMGLRPVSQEAIELAAKTASA